MTCKDCLCKYVCFYIHNAEDVIAEINPLACNHFKPKSRFVELPCEVGQTVYSLDDYVDHEECCKCEHYLIGGFGDPSECGRTKHGFKHPDCIQIVEETATFGNILRWITPSLFTEKIDFGNTVFLSREEAEKALAEKSNNNGKDKKRF